MCVCIYICICVCTCLYSFEETANTLHFASRAKNIQNRPAVQVA